MEICLDLPRPRVIGRLTHHPGTFNTKLIPSALSFARGHNIAGFTKGSGCSQCLNPGSTGIVCVGGRRTAPKDFPATYALLGVAVSLRKVGQTRWLQAPLPPHPIPVGLYHRAQPLR